MGCLRFTRASSQNLKWTTLAAVLQNVSDGAWTCAVLVKRVTPSSSLYYGQSYLAAGTGSKAGISFSGAAAPNQQAVVVDVTGITIQAPTALTNTANPYLLVMSKGAGTVAPRLGWKLGSGGAWTHENCNNTLVDQLAADTLFIGSWTTPADFADDWKGVIGWWEGAMSDINKEALDDNWRTSDWWNSAHGQPKFLAELNVAAASVVDLAGNASALSVSASAPTLDGAETLNGWTFDGTGVTASATITAPTASQNVTTNPFLVTASVVGTPHHIQFEISIDGGTTWQRLSAKNRQSPWETNFNTWRLPNGNYKVRVKSYSGSAESSLVDTSAAIDFTITIAAGTVRDYVGGVDTLSAAITAATAGDTIRLSGVFTNEGGSININKRVKIIQNPGRARAVICSRIRITADGVYCSEVDFIGNNSASPEPEAKAAVLRGEPTNPINFSNDNSGIGIQEASTIPFDADGSFDTLIENANIYNMGNRSTETNSAHGIYAQNSLRLFMRECIFWHNAARQIQLYPQAIEATIYKCAMYDSEMGVLFGGDTSTGAGMGDANGARVFKTNYSTVEDCIIGKGGGDDGSSTDGLVYTFWGNSVGAGTGNEILDTYLHTPPTAGGGSGKYIDTALGGLTSVSGNVTTLTLPGYSSLDNDDFDLVPNAPALGYGPDRIQPSGSIPTQSFDRAGIFPKPRMRKVRA